MTVPNVYRTAPGWERLNYDFIDYTAGRVIVRYYGYKWDTSAASAWGLTNYAIYSHTVNDEVVDSNAAYTTLFNRNFDLLFEVPRIIDGKIIINIPVGINNYTGGTASLQALATASIVGGATIDGPDTSGAFTEAAVQQSAGILTMVLTASDQKIKVGETLRINITIQGKNNGPNNTAFGFGFDPQNRIGNQSGANPPFASGDVTEMHVYIPYKPPN